MSENENTQNNQEGKPSAVSEFTQMVENLKKENENAKKNIEELKEIIARTLIGGNTNAGVQPPKPPVETPKEYMKRVLSNKI